MNNLKAIDQSFEKIFEDLYWDLHNAFPHPFEWLCLLKRPRWWRLSARRAHLEIVAVFAKHGFILTDHLANEFRLTSPQGLDEDCGGSFVRRLRETFQYQTGVPFAPEWRA